MEDTRPFSVACDWCATVMTRDVRRDQAGRMVVVQVTHHDPAGRPCLGSGRGIPRWPLPVELREVGDAYVLRIGQGRPVEFASPGKLVDKLLELGVDQEVALRISAIAPGQPYSFEVAERRRQPRAV